MGDHKKVGMIGSFVYFLSWGKHGMLGIWTVTCSVFLLAICLELTTDWGRSEEVFQRSGALNTALVVPFFAFFLGQLHLWKSWAFAERAKIDAKELAKVQFAVRLKKDLTDSSVVNELNEAFEIDADRIEGVSNTQEYIKDIETKALPSSAILISVSTLVWGFGDLLFSKGCNLCSS